jgi:hypothetical protein
MKKTTKRTTKTARTTKTPSRKATMSKDAKPAAKRVSLLTAAATLLADRKEPMRVREVVATLAQRGLWTSPNGKTPEATLYAAIIREIAAKAKASRFVKVERGLFAPAKPVTKKGARR